jgi:hypothetical protein
MEILTQPYCYLRNPGKVLKKYYRSFQRLSNSVAGIDMIEQINGSLMLSYHQIFAGAVDKGCEYSL